MKAHIRQKASSSGKEGKVLQFLTAQVREMREEMHALLYVLVGEERISKKEAKELKSVLARMKEGERVRLEDA